jgi:hypothetical protein
MTALRPALLLFPLVAFAQVAPPPEIDQALRARVMEFGQYHIDAKFTKAWEMVAKDTKEYYFSGTKNKYESFKIDKIEYTDNFTKAHVYFTYDRIWEIRMQKTRVTASTVEDWKIEDGKWMWYRDESKPGLWPTPFGPSDSAEIERRTTGAIQLPKDMSPDALTRKAQDIFKATQIDKSEVVMSLNRVSVERVTFHNGAPGGVNVELDHGQPVPGLSVELDKTSVEMNKDAVLTISYRPVNNEAPQPHTVWLTVQPFNQRFEIHIKFGEPEKAN